MLTSAVDLIYKIDYSLTCVFHKMFYFKIKTTFVNKELDKQVNIFCQYKKIKYLRFELLR